MRTIEEQHKLLEELLETARQRKSAGSFTQFRKNRVWREEVMEA